MKNSFLVITAHPDDETYGLGGSIMKFKDQGHEVSVFIMTDGVTARHNVKSLQKQAAENACKKLGVDNIIFGDLPDQRLDEIALLEVIKPISKVISDIKPNIVFTHHGGDANQDHRTIFNATIVATRPFGVNPVKELYTYEVASSTEWAPPLKHWMFQPNYYIDISKYINGKVEAALEYSKTFQSEVPPYPHPRSPQAIKIYAEKRGIEVGYKMAEAFQIIRILK